MPARPIRKFTIRNTAKKFGDVPFNEETLTDEAFRDTIDELTSMVIGLSGELVALSGEYLNTVDDLNSLSGELYATTLDASGDIWNLSAAIAELQPVATEPEVEASNEK